VFYNQLRQPSGRGFDMQPESREFEPSLYHDCIKLTTLKNGVIAPSPRIQHSESENHKYFGYDLKTGQVSW
jgi:hypothetical protein